MTDTPRCCVFCGSQFGTKPEYRKAAETVTTALVEAGFGIVYGGGHVGLMGATADAGLAAGAEVIGIIPRDLDQREVSHLGLTELHLVDSMYQRKKMMAELSHSYLILPGGIGTLDELFEVMTATQLGFDPKPIALLNVAGYYDGLLKMLDTMNDQGFLYKPWSDLLRADEEIEPLIEYLKSALNGANQPGDAS